MSVSFTKGKTVCFQNGIPSLELSSRGQAETINLVSLHHWCYTNEIEIVDHVFPYVSGSWQSILNGSHKIILGSQ